MVLTSEELVELTGRVQRSAQRRVLAALGITYGMRPDGSIAVLHDAVAAALGGRKDPAPVFDPAAPCPGYRSPPLSRPTAPRADLPGPRRPS